MGAAITGVVVALSGGGFAEAAPARIQFRIEPKAYSEALLDVAQQANVTLIGAGACVGVSRASLNAVTTLEDALNQVLAGAPCGWKLIAPGAVAVSALPSAAPPVVRPASPVTV